MPFGSGDGRTKNLTKKWKDKDLNLTFVSPETKSVDGSEEQRGAEGVLATKSFEMMQNGRKNTRERLMNSDLRSQTARDR